MEKSRKDLPAIFDMFLKIISYLNDRIYPIISCEPYLFSTFITCSRNLVRLVPGQTAPLWSLSASGPRFYVPCICRAHLRLGCHDDRLPDLFSLVALFAVVRVLCSLDCDVSRERTKNGDGCVNVRYRFLSRKGVDITTILQSSEIYIKCKKKDSVCAWVEKLRINLDLLISFED